MTHSREQLLRMLIAAETPTADVVAQLSQYGWDSDEALAVLGLTDAASVLERYSSGTLDADSVEAWAEAIEGREDIDYHPDADALLDALIFELANPALTAPLSPEAATEWMQRIRANGAESEANR